MSTSMVLTGEREMMIDVLRDGTWSDEQMVLAACGREAEQAAAEVSGRAIARGAMVLRFGPDASIRFGDQFSYYGMFLITQVDHAQRWAVAEPAYLVGQD